MSVDTENFMERWFDEVWNKRNENAIEEMFAEDGLGFGLTEDGTALRGPAGFRPFYHTFLQAFPDLHVTVEKTVVSGNMATAIFRVRGTHSGEGIGLSPTNREVEFTGMVTARIEDGKIVESWNEVDFMKMYMQLGALTLSRQ